ncbi:hypothetical protein PV762_25700 [Mitsuaria sp. CC2]|uniref:hypothetical protein n=1 Tax=Mitsuaria sp. CC2 TaxID=3029186 RepID=UPI003B8D6B90
MSLTEFADVLLGVVVTLYRQPRGKRPSQAGTAVLLDEGSATFLVSAAHVLNDPSGLFFYVETNRVRAITGDRIKRRNDSDGALHRADLATVMLKGSALPPYPQVGKFSLRSSVVMPFDDELLPTDHFMITGVPASRSRANPHNMSLRVKPYAPIVAAAAGQHYGLVGVTPDEHLVLHFDRHGHEDQFGNPVAGISRNKETPRDFYVDDEVWAAMYAVAVPELQDAMDSPT